MRKLSIIKELRSFLLLWSSQTVSQLGTAMTDYALIIWVYERSGTASSVTMLTMCAFLPTILFRFLAGTFVDRKDKKRIMLITDLIAACGSLSVLLLYSGAVLEVWHLYVINIILSFMNSFQVSASYVATSLLVPMKHYARVGALSGISGSVIAILAPALGSILLVFGGLRMVLIVDLTSFAVAFLTLLLFIRIPKTPLEEKKEQESFWKSSQEGIRFLKDSKALLHLTLFIAVVNLFAKLGNDGMLAPYILGRTGNDQKILGLVQAFTSAGILLGSMLMMFRKPARRKTRLIFITCAIILSGDLFLSVTEIPAIWCIAQFGTYAVAAIMNIHLNTLMREKVPITMQGRVFAAQDTLKNCTNPLGLFLGGILADYVFEPFMKTESTLQKPLSVLFGSESGSGIGLLFFIVGTLGMLISITRLKKKVYRELDLPEPASEENANGEKNLPATDREGLENP